MGEAVDLATFAAEGRPVEVCYNVGMLHVAHHRFSFAEYALLVEDKGMKLAFLDGQIWAMPGGTLEHARRTTR